ncbi:MAG: phosphatidate cytidylyltransferase [Sphingomonadaceae bacterium]|nr:phosphatidate cytidylyltransferase [Sphingomonadaceae bacterium]
MAAAEVAREPVPAPGGRSELLTRVVVGAALAAVAIAATWAGGVAFTALVAAACLLMSAEWSVMHCVARPFRLASLGALAFVVVVFLRAGAADALIVLAAAAGLLGLFVRGYDRARAFWVAAGLLYCGLPMVALLWLRASLFGLFYVSLVFAIVWATDIGAFFTGRTFGGPRFARTISPNKTWAGVAGGIAAAVVAAEALPIFGRGRPAVEHGLATAGGMVQLAGFALVGILLAAFAIGGDLLESWLKRRAGVKDSGDLLPGHGGVMDRLDGLVPVAIVAALGVGAGL